MKTFLPFIVVGLATGSIYLLADLAYHRDKFARGWEHLVDIWGADHHGQVKSLQVGLELLGFPPGEPEIILGQLVRIERGGELVRLSRRAGNIITLADILDEVDPDVCRLTFLLQSIDTPQTFDLDVVTSQSMENPVYYVQYAHARIASIGRKASERDVTRRPSFASIIDSGVTTCNHRGLTETAPSPHKTADGRIRGRNRESRTHRRPPRRAPEPGCCCRSRT